MKIFIDSANIEEIEKYLSFGVCDGVTTNPSIYLKSGVVGGTNSIKQKSLEIANLIAPRPLSVEVTSDCPTEVLSQAREYSSWAENITVKVTITDRRGKPLLPVIHHLISENVRLNITAMLTFNQMVLASKCIESARKPSSPTHFVSLFAGRIADEQGIDQAVRTLEQAAKWLKRNSYTSEIIVGSIRRVENFSSYANTGAHILTIPPSVIGESLISARTKETVIQFIEDSEKALGNINN